MTDADSATREHRPAPALLVLTAGAGLGVAWGVAARLWMRYISTDPEFSWGGTLLIIGLAAAAGVSLAAVECLRQRRLPAVRSLLAIPALLLFAGPGAVLAPTALLGGFALSGRGPAWVRAAVGVLALAPLALLSARDDFEVGHSLAGAVAGLLVLSAAAAAGWSVVFRAAPSGRPSPVVSEPVAHGLAQHL